MHHLRDTASPVLLASIFVMSGFNVSAFTVPAAFQTDRSRMMSNKMSNGNVESPYTTTSPGARRRRMFRERAMTNVVPKIVLPLPLISAIVAALKAQNLGEAVPIFLRQLRKEQRTNAALPIAHKPFSELSFCEDCISAQRHARRLPSKPFLLELTPSSCQLDPDDRRGQCRWLEENAARLKAWQLSHGAVYFRSWSLFTDADGVGEAWNALGLTPCRDPKEIRGPAPLLEGSSTIYETLNNSDDAKTHLGLHTEGIPGIAPTSALFSCFEPADVSGGEFLLCDGRGVLRDLDTQTLARLEVKKLRATFAVVPDWIANSPFGSGHWTTDVQREILALVTDLTRPTNEFFLDVFPEPDKKESVKLTTHPAVPFLMHPVTKEPVWFSGMDAGHQGNFLRQNPHLATTPSASDGGGGKYASEVFDVRYGDGTEIAEEDVENVRRACEKNTIEVLMQPGDAVFLDNFTVLHGRKPFVGTRRHTVVWFLD